MSDRISWRIRKNNRFSHRIPSFWYNTFFYKKMALKEKSLNKNRQHISQENILSSCSPLLAYHLKGQHSLYAETRQSILRYTPCLGGFSSPLAIIGITAFCLHLWSETIIVSHIVASVRPGQHVEQR